MNVLFFYKLGVAEILFVVLLLFVIILLLKFLKKLMSKKMDRTNPMN